MGNCCGTKCQKFCPLLPDEETDDGNQAFLEKDLPEVSTVASPATSTSYRALHNNQSPPPGSPSHFSDEDTHTGDSFPQEQQQEEQKQETSTDHDSGHESNTDIIDTDTNASSPQVKCHTEDFVSERTLTPLLPAETEVDTNERAKLLGDEMSGSSDTLEQGFSIDIAMLGSTKVGKTCLIERMTKGETYNFEDDKEPSNGIEVFQCEVQVPLSITKNYSAPLFNVSLWDIPGQITSSSTLKTSLKNKDAICLVYDRTSLSSTEDLVKKTPDVFKYAPGRAHFVFLATKADEFPHPQLDSMTDSIFKIAQKRGIQEYEVSAKTGYSVSDTFFNIIYDTACKKFTERKLREADALETEL
jgi:small GTP-binding protein